MAKQFTVTPQSVRAFMENIFGSNHIGLSAATDEDVARLSAQLVRWGLPKAVVTEARALVNEDRKRITGYSNDPLAGLLHQLDMGDETALGPLY